MEKICLLKQPVGLGDIFYLQKFAYILNQNGYKIIWPIRDDVIWVKDYIKVDWIEFCKLSEDFIGKEYYNSGHFILKGDNFLFISPDGYKLPDKGIMPSKYALIDSSDDEWYNYFTFERNYEKENELYFDVLNLKEDSKYVFWSNMVTTNGSRTYDELNDLSFDIPIVKLKFIDGYTLFDWCKIVENATEIHTAHTGINYIIDKLNLKAKVYKMYQGLHSPDIQYVPFKNNPEYILNP